MLESIRVTGECQEGWPLGWRQRPASSRPLAASTRRPRKPSFNGQKLYEESLAESMPSFSLTIPSFIDILEAHVLLVSIKSMLVCEKLRWPEQELAKKSILNAEESLIIDSKGSISHLSPGILKDIFTTGTSSYNVLLQSKEEKKHHSQKQSSSTYSKRCRKPSKSPSSSRSKDLRKMKAPVPVMSSDTWYCLERQPAVFVTSSVSSPVKFTHGISVTGNSTVLPPKPKNERKVKRRHFSTVPKPKPRPQLSRSFEKGDDFSGKKFCILTAIKPTNLEKEKVRFFKSDYTYNPQFEYANPSLPSVLAKHSNATDRFLKQERVQCFLGAEEGIWDERMLKAVQHQSINIMELTLQKYGSYEKFEQATGGSLLSKTRIWSHVRKYMMKEGCMGEIVVHLTEDLLSRASMTVVNGCPTLTINVCTAREHWLEGMLRHEIGTHYFRGINNLQQPWNSWTGRKKHELKPNNPTEEGLASIHSVLFRRDPFLWRAALLYYTVYRASHMSFCELFKDIGKFVKDPNTRWDYCVRAKRGWTDTSQPGAGFGCGGHSASGWLRARLTGCGTG
ncbi:hypothetical protein J1605_009734 [Eschrichtius robustus]|uniref:KIAA0895 n=1 Tax=Eschrichtius robustus TaxID=9764 RepID=A0AB34GWJ0_ESCRO|nr:hypothetical protein J1605_009734 [Eschrichtius robustus]